MAVFDKIIVVIGQKLVAAVIFHAVEKEGGRAIGEENIVDQVQKYTLK